MVCRGSRQSVLREDPDIDYHFNITAYFTTPHPSAGSRGCARHAVGTYAGTKRADGSSYVCANGLVDNYGRITNDTNGAAIDLATEISVALGVTSRCTSFSSKEFSHENS